MLFRSLKDVRFDEDQEIYIINNKNKYYDIPEVRQGINIKPIFEKYGVILYYAVFRGIFGCDIIFKSDNNYKTFIYCEYINLTHNTFIRINSIFCENRKLHEIIKPIYDKFVSENLVLAKITSERKPEPTDEDIDQFIHELSKCEIFDEYRKKMIRPVPSDYREI